MKPDTTILRAELLRILKEAKTNPDAYAYLANIFSNVGNNLAALSERGSSEAVKALGRIGVAYAHMFQDLSVRDEQWNTEITRPFYENFPFAPGLVSDETRNTSQIGIMVTLGQKWSPYPTWGGRSRKRLNFTSGAAHLANRVAKNAYAKPAGTFKTIGDAFEFGFAQLVKEWGGKKTFVEFFDDPRRLAQSVKHSKGSGRKSVGKKNIEASIATQIAEVKSKVKRVFKTIYIARK